jgi:hypothetical protein
MADKDRLARVTDMLRRRGNIADDLEGDVRATAGEWLARARDELVVLEPILSAGQWRVAYNAAYDIYRHAAEAIDLSAGYRILASAGAHSATFALAAAVIGDQTDVFGATQASTMTGTRNRLEYLDAGRSMEVGEGDARWAVQLAARAVADASSFLA